MLKRLCSHLLYLVIIFVNEAFAEAQPGWFESTMEAPWVGVAFNGLPCDGEKMSYGPFDYTNPKHVKYKLNIVEEYHFTRETELLLPEKRGLYVGQIRIGGMQYTLTAFPNHHKALRGMAQYHILFKNDIESGKKKPSDPAVECWFQRAIQFAPKDATVRIIYATYLKQINRYDQADKLYQEGVSLEPDRLNFRYNYGMFLVEQKKYSEALEQAKIVYKSNYPKDVLKQKLIKAGFWSE